MKGILKMLRSFFKFENRQQKVIIYIFVEYQKDKLLLHLKNS